MKDKQLERQCRVCGKWQRLNDQNFSSDIVGVHMTTCRTCAGVGSDFAKETGSNEAGARWRAKERRRWDFVAYKPNPDRPALPQVLIDDLLDGGKFFDIILKGQLQAQRPEILILGAEALVDNGKSR